MLPASWPRTLGSPHHTLRLQSCSVCPAEGPAYSELAGFSGARSESTTAHYDKKLLSAQFEFADLCYGRLNGLATLMLSSDNASCVTCHQDQ
eukprot:1157347-Pelagomonas_calceolata.AAC.2